MIKILDIGDYHLRFNTENGFMARWGKTPDDDPSMCPIGPEIADIEISTICHGIGKAMGSRKPCTFCYKSNTGCGENMSLETFKKVFALFPKTLTQIAFGIGDIGANPDIFSIMAHCRENNVVPNVTTNGMGLNEVYKHTHYGAATYAYMLRRLCGAVAVSHYGDDDLCFDTINDLTRTIPGSEGLQQVNIHKLLAKETLKDCYTLIDKVATDPRCAKMKAIVFLLLKPKGDRNRFTPVENLASYGLLYNHALEKGVQIGFDSCSAPHALRTIPLDNPLTLMSMECCESTLFSIYVDVKARIHPCSFCENVLPDYEPIDLLKVKDFTSEVWKAPQIQRFRERLIASSSGCNGICDMARHCRSCPVYDVTICRGKTDDNRPLPGVQGVVR